MKNYLICAGGSGVRALESMLHLCAAGIGPDEIRVLIIDPDGANGNYERANHGFNDYADCHNAYGGKLGDVRFFHTALSTIRGGAGLQVWSPVDMTKQFSDLLGNLTATHQDVANLLFTETERGMKLEKGFKGHPALGAAALALLPLYVEDPVWKKLNADLSGDLAAQAATVRVVIVGSVFGGTGASAFYPLARRLHEIAGAKKDRLRIGVVALAPYFTFSVPGDPSAAKDRPDARKFPLATRGAAAFYHHLRSRPDSWPFDAMFWLGDDTPMNVVPAEGGEEQKNSAHFVDLLAALTCLDYFSQPEDAVFDGCCFYAGPTGAGDSNVTTWDDVPLIPPRPKGGQREEDIDARMRDRHNEIRRRLLRFALAGAMHIGFFAGLFEGQNRLQSRPTMIPWYFERFESKGHSLTARPHVDSLVALSRFLRLRHFPWWKQVTRSADEHELRVQLLNTQPIRCSGEEEPECIGFDLGRLANLLFPQQGDRDLDAVHRFLTYTFAPPKREEAKQAPHDGAPAYLAVLADAANECMRQEGKYKAV